MLASSVTLMHWNNLVDSSARCSSSEPSGPMKPYASKIPRNVPTSAEAISLPSSAGGRPTEPIVCTTPITAATMPKAGMASPTLVMMRAGCSASWWWVSIS